MTCMFFTSVDVWGFPLANISRFASLTPGGLSHARWTHPMFKGLDLGMPKGLALGILEGLVQIRKSKQVKSFLLRPFLF